MKNSIAQEFKFFSLLRFALPTMIMMIVMGMYTIVDSMFVSRFVNTNALSAINIVYPFINIILALGIMLATGGSAIVAAKMGSGKIEEARKDFSLITIAGLVAGIIVSILGLIFIRPIVYALGASDLLYQYAHDYLKMMLIFAPACILQTLFQTFFVTAGKPMLGLTLTISAGLVNVVLDYLFIVPLNMGITGAALATGIGYLIPSGVGIVFFLRKKGFLHFSKPIFDKKVLLDSCSNGSSEMVGNLSVGVSTFLFNIIMMKFLGEDGVAAITIVLYAHFLMTALYLGFSMGVAPIISYNYGSKNSAQLKRLFRICMIFIAVSSVIVYFVSTMMAQGIVTVFAPVGSNVYLLAMAGFALFPINFLFAGFNIYASALFTAYSNGKISALLSFMRTFVFLVLGLLIMPFLWDVSGIWLAVPVAEFAACFLSAFCLYKWRHPYHLT